MKLTRPDLAALAVLSVVVVAIAACAIFRVDVPAVLSELGLLLAGIAGGAAIPTQQATPPADPAPAPLPPAPAPAPAPLTAEPATGVFARVASHQ